MDWKNDGCLVKKTSNGFCFVDQYGEYSDEILRYCPKEKIKDLVYLDFSNIEYPVGLNPLEVSSDDLDEKNMVVDNFVDILTQIYGSKTFDSNLQDCLRNACLLLMDQPENTPGHGGGTIVEIMRLFTDDYFLRLKLHNVKNSKVASRREKDYNYKDTRNISRLQEIINSLLNSPCVKNILCQPNSCTDFYQAMKENKKIICNLDRKTMGDFSVEVLGRVLMMKINMALLKCKIEGDDSSYILYVDDPQVNKRVSSGNNSNNGLLIKAYGDEPFLEDIKLDNRKTATELIVVKDVMTLKYGSRKDIVEREISFKSGNI